MDEIDKTGLQSHRGDVLSILLEVDNYWYQDQINELSRSDSDFSNASTIIN